MEADDESEKTLVLSDSGEVGEEAEVALRPVARRKSPDMVVVTEDLDCKDGAREGSTWKLDSGRPVDDDIDAGILDRIDTSTNGFGGAGALEEDWQNIDF